MPFLANCFQRDTGGQALKSLSLPSYRGSIEVLIPQKGEITVTSALRAKWDSLSHICIRIYLGNSKDHTHTHTHTHTHARLGMEATGRLVGVGCSRLHGHTTPHWGLQTRQTQHTGTTALPIDHSTHCTQTQTVCRHALSHEQAAHQCPLCFLHIGARARTPTHTLGGGALDSSPGVPTGTHYVTTLSLLQGHR